MPSGSWPAVVRTVVRRQSRERSTAAAAIPAQTPAHSRCATGVMVWVWMAA